MSNELSGEKQEVFISGAKCSGVAASHFKSSSDWFAYFISYLIVWLFLHKVDFFVDMGFLAVLFFIAIAAPLFFVVNFLIRKYCKKSVSYNADEKKFYFNEHSKFPFSKTSIEIQSITGIRYRYLEFSFFDKYFKNAATYQPGKYYTVAFDFEEDASWDVWFTEKSEAEKFLQIIDSAIKANGMKIESDKNEEPIKYVDYVTEILENKEEAKTAALKNMKLIRGMFIVIATLIILMLLGFFMVAILD